MEPANNTGLQNNDGTIIPGLAALVDAVTTVTKQVVDTKRRISPSKKLAQPVPINDIIRNTSKYKGVSWEQLKGKWKVRIRKDGKYTHIAYVADELEAARLWDAVALTLHGPSFGPHLNFPTTPVGGTTSAATTTPEIGGARGGGGTVWKHKTTTSDGTSHSPGSGGTSTSILSTNTLLSPALNPSLMTTTTTTSLVPTSSSTLSTTTTTTTLGITNDNTATNLPPQPPPAAVAPAYSSSSTICTSASRSVSSQDEANNNSNTTSSDDDNNDTHAATTTTRNNYVWLDEDDTGDGATTATTTITTADRRKTSSQKRKLVTSNNDNDKIQTIRSDNKFPSTASTASSCNISVAQVSKSPNHNLNHTNKTLADVGFAPKSARLADTRGVSSRHSSDNDEESGVGAHFPSPHSSASSFLVSPEFDADPRKLAFFMRHGAHGVASTSSSGALGECSSARYTKQSTSKSRKTSPVPSFDPSSFSHGPSSSNKKQRMNTQQNGFRGKGMHSSSSNERIGGNTINVNSNESKYADIQGDYHAHRQQHLLQQQQQQQQHIANEYHEYQKAQYQRFIRVHVFQDNSACLVPAFPASAEQQQQEEEEDYPGQYAAVENAEYVGGGTIQQDGRTTTNENSITTASYAHQGPSASQQVSGIPSTQCLYYNPPLASLVPIQQRNHDDHHDHDAGDDDELGYEHVPEDEDEDEAEQRDNASIPSYPNGEHAQQYSSSSSHQQQHYYMQFQPPLPPHYHQLQQHQQQVSFVAGIPTGVPVIILAHGRGGFRALPVATSTMMRGNTSSSSSSPSVHCAAVPSVSTTGTSKSISNNGIIKKTAPPPGASKGSTPLSLS